MTGAQCMRQGKVLSLQVQELSGQLRPALEGCSDDPPLVALFLTQSAQYVAAVLACLCLGCGALRTSMAS